jgi:predicted signal transduction protein with EAL and GGDEF domain
MLARFQPDVILMDAMMPVMDGFTACARMQELPNGADIPVLMITALQDNSSVERAFAAGASDYIPKPIHYAVLSQRVRRIIEANRAEKRIRHLAYNDVLTNLPNRTLFFELLAKSIDHARSAGQQVAVLFMDLDRFKYVNDNLGHAIGDRLLQAVAQRVRQTVRRPTPWRAWAATNSPWCSMSWTARRPPAPHTTSCALSAPFPIDGHEIFVTASVGIAMFPHDGGDVATLVKHADSAMYRAKRTNTGFQFYESSMEHSISEHVRLESDLRRAMEQQHQLEVYYQPQACLSSGRIIGMEALVRWRHPTRGMIRRRSSFRWPRKPASSTSSATGCCAPPARSCASSCATACRSCAWRSTCRCASCCKNFAPRWKRCWPTPACRRTCWNWKSPKAR